MSNSQVLTDRAQENPSGVFTTHVRQGKDEQFVGAGAVDSDGGPSTQETIGDGGPDAPLEDGDYVPGKEDGIEEEYDNEKLI